MKLIVSRSAQGDLEDIAKYTIEKWGQEQTDQYLDAIESHFRMLIANPHFGRSRPELRKGYRSLLAEHHLILYRLTEDCVIVLRVLHESMDISSAIAKDDVDPS